MKKNYYDILEINQNASTEIVEKAYKTLAKKYHPDLQDETLKDNFEAKMKELNEAYAVISNPEKREQYNRELEQLKKEKEKPVARQPIKTEPQMHTQNPLQNQLGEEQLKQQMDAYARQQSIQQAQYEQEMQKAVQQAYHDAYIQDLKNRGYKIKYKKSFKDYIQIAISLILTLAILFLIFQIPFVKTFFINLYEENEIIHTFVDIILQLFAK